MARSAWARQQLPPTLRAVIPADRRLRGRKGDAALSANRLDVGYGKPDWCRTAALGAFGVPGYGGCRIDRVRAGGLAGCRPPRPLPIPPRSCVGGPYGGPR